MEGQWRANGGTGRASGGTVKASGGRWSGANRETVEG